MLIGRILDTIAARAVVVCALLLLTGCWAAPPHSDLVLVTVDTLRADHLGCYGYPRPVSPFIDSLAGTGVQFTTAISSMSTTVPSHCSIFTGLHPAQHGVTDNKGRLDSETTTIVQHLHDLGFLTAGFVSTEVHFRPSGLDRGFEVFDDSSPAVTRPATETCSRAIDWLSGHDDQRRLFLWIHLFDTHYPYDENNKYRDSSIDGASEHLEYLLRHQKRDLGSYGGNRDLMLHNVGLYDGELSVIDTALEGLYSALSRHRNTPTVWIVTADHGEGLGNHGYLGHGRNIYNEQIRVPLVFHSTSGRFPGRTVDEVAELISMPLTISGVLGLEVPFAQPESDASSLAPYLDGAPPAMPTRIAFSQRRTFSRKLVTSVDTDQRQAASDLKSLWRIDKLSGYEAGQTYAIQTARYKYLLRTEGPEEFYDLAADPYETNNIIFNDSEERDTMRRELLAMIKTYSIGSDGREPPVDKEILEKLDALGYLR